jgi:hypothetical protein
MRLFEVGQVSIHRDQPAVPARTFLAGAAGWLSTRLVIECQRIYSGQGGGTALTGALALPTNAKEKNA